MGRAKRPELGGLARIGVAIDADLLARFDTWCAANGRGNRSEAFRDLIRDRLVEAEMDERAEVVAAVSLVYDHHRREVVNHLLDIQHDHGDVIISAQHVHLDHDNCLEIIAVKGRGAQVKLLADALKSVKGVKHATLSVTSAGE